jgi:hypothetical protein
MESLFADVLPPATVVRADKADLKGVFVGEHSRRFVDGWTGSGLPEGAVDVPVLREAWREGDWRSLPLLQAAWLATEGQAPAVTAIGAAPRG